MSGLIGKKIGMTSIFDEQGKHIACTVIEAGPCYVTQMKTIEKDGYDAVQIGFDTRKEKNTPKPLQGHFKKSGVPPKRKLVELTGFETEKKLGEKITLDLFEEGEYIDITGISKGKGFQGVVKRHGFSGVGSSTHGQHDRLRAPGSIGASSFPSRVVKGMRMAGRMGNNNVKIKNLKIIKILKDKNLLIVKGAVAGAKGSYLILEK